MSRSLIRKNQLHPDIADLVSGYGDNFFITPVELTQALSNFGGGNLQNVVYTTGNQTINGLKNFSTRPAVNGVGVLLQGEGAGGEVNIQNVVYTTGNQNISGEKTFINQTKVDSVNFIRNFISTGGIYNHTTSGVVQLTITGVIFTGWNQASMNPSDDSRSIRLSSGSYVRINFTQRGGSHAIAWEAITDTGNLLNRIPFSLFSGNTPLIFSSISSTNQLVSVSGYLPQQYNRFIVRILGGGGPLPSVNVSGDFGISREIRLESRNNRLFLGNSGVAFQGEAAAPSENSENLLYITGDQIIEGVKNFTTRPTLSGVNLITTEDLIGLELEINNINNVIPLLYLDINTDSELFDSNDSTNYKIPWNRVRWVNQKYTAISSTIDNTKYVTYNSLNKNIYIKESGIYNVDLRFGSFNMIDPNDFLRARLRSSPSPIEGGLSTNPPNPPSAGLSEGLNVLSAFAQGPIGVTQNGEAMCAGFTTLYLPDPIYITADFLHFGAFNISNGQNRGFPVFNNVFGNRPFLFLSKIV
jgi:hypothetical protein